MQRGKNSKISRRRSEGAQSSPQAHPFEEGIPPLHAIANIRPDSGLMLVILRGSITFMSKK